VSAIDFAPVADNQDQDHELVAVDVVEDPVVTDPDTQDAAHPDKRFGAGRPGIGSQRIDSGTDPLPDRTV
jgi:hypothetical protein